MKKKAYTFFIALVCVITCAIFLAACGGKEINYLKVDCGDGQLKTQHDMGSFKSDRLDEIKSGLSGFTFYYEYYPDKSTEKADMSKVGVKHFVNGNEYAGLPQTLQANCSYTVCYYYEGHEPSADFSDALVVTITFMVTGDE